MKRKWVILTICLSVVCQYSYSQVADLLPRSMTAGNISTCRTDVWTAFKNPASLVQEESWQVAMQYENRYITRELNTAIVQAGYTNKYVNVGIGYSFFGYGSWNEMMATVVLSRSFGRFSLGLAADIISVYAGSELGYQTTAVPQLGMTVMLSKTVCLGFHSLNPFIQSLRVNEQKRQLPALYSLGVDWQFYTNMRASMDVDYDINSTFRVAAGYEWQPLTQFGVQVGCSYERYFVPDIGIDLHFGSFRFDGKAEWHPVLGVCIEAKVSYCHK